ncbi:ShlB/FhaC/HecB family hemolysin secretion/activation protein [Aquabacterium fontiphilum]|uniref:ShlB/FhaC/HecB family hemolysin secretion/activation protein n=1 Tax=Aquabacterium fontiphilum TaxID=450365 RepID=UPI0013771FFB|nr:ShlB/FhaC/HecB family hemolysin secretion/activation protein [Aquabacterium fontiphilum]NBD20318.1 ShlB/FhaC/HecB family hemolysin secretion/activation protein [Aquabacterium fontiphilum]
MAVQKTGRLARTGLGAVMWACASALCAQAPDPAELAQRALQEELLRQQREQATAAQRRTGPDVRLPAPELDRRALALPADEQPCFRIDHIQLTGDDAKRFTWALDAAGKTPDGSLDTPLGRCLGAEGVRAVMSRIQNALIARGFVTTRVLAPPQQLSTGTLTLTVVPGRVRSIRSGQVSDPDRLTWWNALPVQPGDLLNLRDIEQGLENFKRAASVSVDIQIVPSEAPDARPGDSDLVISWQQGLPLKVAFSFDDTGSRATGVYQGGLTLVYDHPFTLHDQLVLSLQHDLGGGRDGARGSASQSVQYTVPFGYWLLGVSGGESRYHQTVTAGPLSYRYSGNSRTGDIRLGRVIYRDAAHKVSATMKGWSKASRNYVNDAEVLVQRRQTGGWEAGFQHRAVWGGAVTDVGLNYRRGTGAFNALPAPEEASGTGTSRMAVILADAQLNQSFRLGGMPLRHQAVARVQWNRTPLSSPDRFGIGSRYTVRGFDGESQLAGERGWLVRQDLGWAPTPAPHEVYVGLDHGRVGGNVSGSAQGRSLTGAAFGLRGAVAGIAYDVFMAWPLRAPHDVRPPGSVGGFSLQGAF